MNVHKNAPHAQRSRRSGPKRGRRWGEQGRRAYRFNTTPTVARWVERCRKEDVESLLLRIPNK
jgi:hypothetical protein